MQLFLNPLKENKKISVKIEPALKLIIAKNLLPVKNTDQPKLNHFLVTFLANKVSAMYCICACFYRYVI